VNSKRKTEIETCRQSVTSTVFTAITIIQKIIILSFFLNYDLDAVTKKPHNLAHDDALKLTDSKNRVHGDWIESMN